MIVAKYQGVWGAGFGAAALRFTSPQKALDYIKAAVGVTSAQVARSDLPYEATQKWLKANNKYLDAKYEINKGNLTAAKLESIYATITAADKLADEAAGKAQAPAPRAPAASTPAPTTPTPEPPPPEHTTPPGGAGGLLAKFKQQPMLAAGVGLAAIALVALFWPKGRAA